MDHLTEEHCGLFIVVEGNIGCGKTDFCHILGRIRAGRDGPTEVLLEPVGEPRFRRFLGRYYTDPKRWGFAFQMHALQARLKQHTLAVELSGNGTHVIQDRSIYADGCFGLTVREDGNMSDDEWGVYADTFGMMKRWLRYPDILVYLQVPPAVCHERMKLRERAEEAGVSLEYLERIHEKHEELAEAMARYTRVLRVDWSQFGRDVEDVNKSINELANEPLRFIRDFRRL